MEEIKKANIVSEFSLLNTRISSATVEIEEGIGNRNPNAFANERMEFTARTMDAFPQRQEQAGIVQIEFDPVCCIGNSSLHRKFNKALKPPMQPIRKLSHHVSSKYNNSYRFDLSSSTIMSSCTFEDDFQISNHDRVNDNLSMICGSSVESQTTNSSSFDRRSRMSTPPVPPRRQNSLAIIFADSDLEDNTDSFAEFSDY